MARSGRLFSLRLIQFAPGSFGFLLFGCYFLDTYAGSGVSVGLGDDDDDNGGWMTWFEWRLELDGWLGMTTCMYESSFYIRYGLDCHSNTT